MLLQHVQLKTLLSCKSSPEGSLKQKLNTITSKMTKEKYQKRFDLYEGGAIDPKPNK